MKICFKFQENWLKIDQVIVNQKKIFKFFKKLLIEFRKLYDLKKKLKKKTLKFFWHRNGVETFQKNKKKRFLNVV